METEESKKQTLLTKYDSQVTQLKNQITIIELRQQELQNYITSLDQTVRQIDRTVFTEEQQPKPDYIKIKNLRFISSKNMELITDIYNTYQKFEDVKFKYFKEIGGHAHAGNRLIHIELYKLENQTDNISDSFMDMLKYLSSIPNIEKPVVETPGMPVGNILADDDDLENNLETNPEYQL